MDTDSLNILTELQPLHLPEPVPFWPPAPGWYIAGLMVLLLMSWGLIRWLRYLRSQRYRRVAQRLLREIAGRKEDNPGEKLRAVNELLKRVALQTYPREKVASLSGKASVKVFASSIRVLLPSMLTKVRLSTRVAPGIWPAFLSPM